MKTSVNEDLLRRANERIEAMQRVDELSEPLKEAKAKVKELADRDKDDGYNPKVLDKAIKELRMPKDEFQKVLELEVEHRTYREGLGLDPEIPTAAKAAMALEQRVDADGADVTVTLAGGLTVPIGKKARERMKQDA